MPIVTIKINVRTRKTQYLLGLISEIAKSDKNVEIVGDIIESPYNPDFVKEILKSRTSEGKVIKTEDLWR